MAALTALIALTALTDRRLRFDVSVVFGCLDVWTYGGGMGGCVYVWLGWCLQEFWEFPVVDDRVIHSVAQLLARVGIDILGQCQ